MILRKLCVILVAGALAQCSGAAGAQRPAAPGDLLALYQQLNRVSVDPSQVYFIRDARISRGGINFYFDHGFLGLFTPVAGRITGAVFVGVGEVLLIPPNPVEKRSLAQFTKSAVLEETINSAYLRFTDDTAQELLRRARRPDPEDPEQPPADFAQGWNKAAGRLNAVYSARILESLVSGREDTFFQARVDGITLGSFELSDDESRPEAIRVDAQREAQGHFYTDIWCSYPSRASKAREEALRAGAASVVSYKIDTQIADDNSLQGRAELTLVSHSSAARILTFDLSHQLHLLGVKDEQGRKLIVLPEADPEEPSMGERSRDWVAVVLEAPQPAGSQFRLTFTYQGDVIKDVGNGVLYVEARGSWYPNRGFFSHATYDLSFRYPDRLTLVATGRRVEEEDDAKGWKHSRWISDGLFPVAGFNLGVYVTRRRKVGKVSIEVYATREAEAALGKRYQQASPPVVILSGPSPEGRKTLKILPPPLPPPLDPAALLDNVLAKAAGAVRYFDTLFGPFPYPRLALAQIPGDFGQGWPELVYLPTLSFIPEDQLRQLGQHARDAELDSDAFVTHEIAHQWWGNEVGWKSYHDQWLSEGFATYAAALALAQEKNGDRKMYELLRGYKQALLSKTPDGQTVESGGPIWLGERLTSSLNPSGYDNIVYKKSCWVLQMLRELMTDPKTGSDERFFKMLRAFADAYEGKNPSTEDFLKEVERFMTPAMDLDGNHTLNWFFEDWVYGTGIPTYKLHAKTRHLAGKRYVVEGTIEQSGVSDDFEMPVPVVATEGKDRDVLLGRVAVSSAGGRFRFATSFKPSRVEIDTENLLAIAK